MKNRFLIISLFIGGLALVIFVGASAVSAQGLCGAGQVFSDACERCISASFSVGATCASPAGGQLDSCGDCGCTGGEVNCSGTCSDNQSGDSCDAGGGRAGTLNSCGTTCTATPRPPVTLAPFGSDTDNTGNASIWVNKVPRTGEDVVVNPLAQLQESGSDRLRVDPNGNLRIIGRPTGDGGDLYLNSGKSIRVDGAGIGDSGITSFNFQNLGTGRGVVVASTMGMFGAYINEAGPSLTTPINLRDGENLLYGVADPAGSAGNAILLQRWNGTATGEAEDLFRVGINGDITMSDSLIRITSGTRRIDVGATGSSATLDVEGAVSTDTLVVQSHAEPFTVGNPLDPPGLTAGQNLIRGIIDTESSGSANALLLQSRSADDGELFDIFRVSSGGNLVVGNGGSATINGQLKILHSATSPTPVLGGTNPGALYYSTDATAPARPGLRVWDGDSWEGLGGGGDLLATLNLGANAAAFTNLTTVGGPISVGTTGVDLVSGKCPTNYSWRDADGDRSIENGECFGNVIGSGNLALSAPSSATGAGHITLNSGKSIFVQAPSARSSLNISNSATGSLGTQLNVGGNIQISERGAFGGYGIDSNWWVTTPSIYVGAGGVGTIIGAGGRQGAGEVTTDRRLTVGGTYGNPSAPAGSPDATKVVCLTAGSVAVDFDGDGGQGTVGLLDNPADLGECYIPPGSPAFEVVGGQLHVVGSGRVTQSLVVGGNPPRSSGSGRGEVGIETRLTVGGSYSNPIAGACIPPQVHLNFDEDDPVVIDDGECYWPPSGAAGVAVVGGDLAVLRGARVKEDLFTTGRNSFTGGEGVPFILGLGPIEGDEDTAAAQLDNYLLIRNMDVDGPPAGGTTTNPSEQYAIRVMDENNQEWFSVRRTGYMAGELTPVEVRTSGGLSFAGTLSSTSSISTTGPLSAGPTTLGSLTVTGVTSLGTSGVGTSIVGNLGVNGNTILGNASTDTTTINGAFSTSGGAIDLGGTTTETVTASGALRVGTNLTVSGAAAVGGKQIANSSGELRMQDIAGTDFDTHNPAASAVETEEGYLILGLLGSERGTCTNVCARHGLVCKYANQVGLTLSSTPTAGAGCTDGSNSMNCWCGG